MTNFPFQRLQAELSVLIANTPAGERLLSEPKLAKKLGVSRATLREAMRSFEAQGMIRRRQGAGTFVVGQVSVLDSGLEMLESLDTMARRLNLAITVSDLRIDRVQADQDLAESLNVPLDSSLISIERVIRADGRPVAYLVDTLPEEFLDLDELPEDFTGSILDFLLDRGTPLTFSRAAISAAGATADVARALEIQREDVLLQFKSQIFSADGSVVDYTESNFIPGYFNFHVIRRINNS
jgi:GntR family transcriptional regulator